VGHRNRGRKGLVLDETGPGTGVKWWTEHRPGGRGVLVQIIIVILFVLLNVIIVLALFVLLEVGWVFR
jgi:hypothetical protein